MPSKNTSAKLLRRIITSAAAIAAVAVPHVDRAARRRYAAVAGVRTGPLRHRARRCGNRRRELARIAGIGLDEHAQRAADAEQLIVFGGRELLERLAVCNVVAVDREHE